MRDREVLLFELNIIASCKKETQLAWLNFLTPEEREMLNIWFKETIECLGKIMMELKPILERSAVAFQQFIKGLSPIILECIQEMAEGKDNAEDGD